jgi:hypothetical protein
LKWGQLEVQAEMWSAPVWNLAVQIVFRFLAIGLLVNGASAGQAKDLIMAKTKSEQFEIMRAAVMSSGSSCPEVTRIFHKGTHQQEDTDYFAVRCSKSGDFLVQIENHGNMKSRTLPCELVASLGISCWDRF